MDRSAPRPDALPDAARLKAPSDFVRVQRGGRDYDFGTLVFRIAPAGGKTLAPTGYGRLGLVVSKKVGNAVVRNRVKRLVRECFRVRKADLAGIDVVAVARPGAASLARADVDRIFESLLGRLRPR